jgi:putative transcriptional regulator
MRITWKLRMAAAQRGVWTGTALRQLLTERAGLQMSSASVSALFTKQPAQVKLETLIALCTALGCTPNDLFDIDTTPVPATADTALPVAAGGGQPTTAPTPAGRGRSLPPL